MVAVSAGRLALACGGAALVLVALGDMFLTIFNYDGYTTLTTHFHRAWWRLVRIVAAPLPRKLRELGLSVGSASMLPASVAAWLGLQITGFALLYDSGVEGNAFRLKDASRSLGTAFYLSAGDISSLTFGDVVARSGLYRALLDVETILGLATFTLALGYVVTAFGVLGTLGTLHGRVRRHADDLERPESIVSRHFRGGSPSDLPSFLQALGEDLDSYDQGLRRYPVVYYFHTRRRERSVPHVFTALGDLIALLRYGLPADDPVAEDPFLAALHDGYRITLDRMRRSFVGPRPFELPEPLDRERFEHAWQLEGADAGVDAFRSLDRLTREITSASEQGIGDLHERYERWLPFAYEQQVVLDRVAGRLGYPRPAPVAPISSVSRTRGSSSATRALRT
jgi:hypothetical protein